MKSMGKTIVTLLCLALAPCLMSTAALGFTPSTGDRVLDSRLDAINAYAAKDKEGFISGISETYRMDPAAIQDMLSQGMSAADVFMTLRLAEITDRPADAVRKAYLSNPGKGWGVIAKSLGVKPGSADFKSLKSGAEAVTEKGTSSKAEKGTSGKGGSGNKGGKGSKGGGKDK